MIALLWLFWRAYRIGLYLKYTVSLWLFFPSEVMRMAEIGDTSTLDAIDAQLLGSTRRRAMHRKRLQKEMVGTIRVALVGEIEKETENIDLLLDARNGWKLQQEPVPDDCSCLVTPAQ